MPRTSGRPQLSRRLDCYSRLLRPGLRQRHTTTPSAASSSTVASMPLLTLSRCKALARSQYTIAGSAIALITSIAQVSLVNSTAAPRGGSSSYRHHIMRPPPWAASRHNAGSAASGSKPVAAPNLIEVKSAQVIELASAPGEIRTPDPQVRSLMLYPTELRARGADSTMAGRALGHGFIQRQQSRLSLGRATTAHESRQDAQ